MTIRRLGPGDSLSDLVVLSKEFFEEYEAHHEFFQLDVLQDEHIRDHLLRLLKSDEAGVFAAEEAGRIVGYTTVRVRQQEDFWRAKRYGVISGLMVSREHRRRGHGGRLLAAATAYLRQQGIQYYTLYTATNNRPAIAFYEEQGLTPLHVTMIGVVDDVG